MAAPQRTHRTIGPEDQQYRGPQPGPPRTRQIRPGTRSHPRRPWPGPVLAQGPRRRSRSTTQGGNSSSVGHRPGASGRPQACSRRNAGIQTGSAQRGITGSNQALNALARTINVSWLAQRFSPPDPQRCDANLTLRRRLCRCQPRPVASFNPMPSVGHDRLPRGNLAGMVAYVTVAWRRGLGFAGSLPPGRSR